MTATTTTSTCGTVVTADRNSVKVNWAVLETGCDIRVQIDFLFEIAINRYGALRWLLELYCGNCKQPKSLIHINNLHRCLQSPVNIKKLLIHTHNMDVAKRLEFDPTDTLSGLGVQDAAHLRFQSANMSALQELERWAAVAKRPFQLIFTSAFPPSLPVTCCRAVQELSAASKQKQTQILDLSRQSAEQGIGDNDLKRLQRLFDSTKATSIQHRAEEAVYGRSRFSMLHLFAGDYHHSVIDNSAMLCNCRSH